MIVPNKVNAEPTERPSGLTLAASLLASVSLLSGIGIFILATNTYGHPQTGWFPAIGQLLAGIFLFVLATLTAATAVIAIGLIYRRNWARVGGVILGWFPVVLALGLVLQSRLSGILVLLVPASCGAILAMYLGQEDVRLYFHNSERRRTDSRFR